MEADGEADFTLTGGLHFEDTGLVAFELGDVEYHLVVLLYIFDGRPDFELDTLVAAGIDETLHDVGGDGDALLVAVAVVPEGTVVVLELRGVEQGFQFVGNGLDEDVALEGGTQLVVGCHIGPVLGVEIETLFGIVLGIDIGNPSLEEAVGDKILDGRAVARFAPDILLKQQRFDGLRVGRGHDEPRGLRLASQCFEAGFHRGIFGIVHVRCHLLTGCTSYSPNVWYNSGILLFLNMLSSYSGVVSLEKFPKITNSAFSLQCLAFPLASFHSNLVKVGEFFPLLC